MEQSDDRATQSSILRELEWRGFLFQRTHEQELDEKLHAGPITLYCGFDPSADSLHSGSLLPILALAHFKRHGHNPIGLVGGATGMIGDPSGKSEERNLLDAQTVEENLAGIQTQIQTILERAITLHPETLPEGVEPNPNPFRVVNNADWFEGRSFLGFLRDVGKYFRVNQMVAKDSVRSRLESEQGISYTEFSYMLIQAFDFLHLYNEENCQLQIGGSDQWGNITAGTELIHKAARGSAFGATFPLLTDSNGRKLGKTEAGAVWLNAERTSPYQFYQYWVRQGDEEMSQLLRMMTFLPQDEVEQLEGLIEAGDNRGEVQRKLAWEVTALVHGAEEADRATKASRVLYGGSVDDLDDRTLRSIFEDVPSLELQRERLEGEGVALVDLLVESGLQSSKSAARRLAEKDMGAYINNERVEEKQRQVTLDDRATESTILLRSGKKKYCLVEIID